MDNLKNISNWYRSPNTFWASTGLFPQELVVSFQGSMNLSSVKIDCCSGKYNTFYNLYFFKNTKIYHKTFIVKHLRIQRSVSNDPVDFEPIHERGKFSNQPLTR